MSILDKIKIHKVDEVASLKAAGIRATFEATCRNLPPPRGFIKAIAHKYSTDRIALIAEIKKASPSKGLIRAELDVPSIARGYQDGDATCLSVLTDARFFQGHGDDISLAASVTTLPVLRKDFLIDPLQVLEARAMRADCVLLILAMIENAQAHELEAAAHELGLDVLIEVHNDAELDRALAMRSPLIGINNRDLTTFKADLAISERLARRIDHARLVVSESGIDGPDDLGRLLDCGIRSFLIGESLLRSNDIKTAAHQISNYFKESINE